LKHKQTGKVRLLMRREKIFKICANHFLLPTMELKAVNDKSWQWFVLADFSEEQLKPEHFCARFTSVESASSFKNCFDTAKTIQTTTTTQVPERILEARRTLAEADRFLEKSKQSKQEIAKAREEEFRKAQEILQKYEQLAFEELTKQKREEEERINKEKVKSQRIQRKEEEERRLEERLRATNEEKQRNLETYRRSEKRIAEEKRKEERLAEEKRKAEGDRLVVEIQRGIKETTDALHKLKQTDQDIKKESDQEISLQEIYPQLETECRDEELEKAMCAMQGSDIRKALNKAKKRKEKAEERHKELKEKIEALEKGEKARKARVYEAREKEHKCNTALEMTKSKVENISKNLEHQFKYEQRCKEILQDRIQNEKNIPEKIILAKTKYAKCRTNVSTLTKTIEEKKRLGEEKKSSSWGFFGLFQ